MDCSEPTSRIVYGKKNIQEALLEEAIETIRNGKLALSVSFLNIKYFIARLRHDNGNYGVFLKK